VYTTVHMHVKVNYVLPDKLRKLFLNFCHKWISFMSYKNAHCADCKCFWHKKSPFVLSSLWRQIQWQICITSFTDIATRTQHSISQFTPGISTFKKKQVSVTGTVTNKTI